MLDNNFDPYEILIQLNERLTRLEIVHNKLARSYQLSQRDLDVALQTINHLQKVVLDSKRPRRE